MRDGIYNAIIDDVKLRIDDHGLLTFDVYVMHECGHQAFGGYCLLNTAQKSFDRHSGDYTGWFIKRVFEVTDVYDFDALIGKTIRIRIEDGLIRAIGHIIKDDWFCPRDDFRDEAD